jgi:hypothetical protein
LDQEKINRICAVTPFVFSGVALALVWGTAMFIGIERANDEGTFAHIFQFLIAGQIPFVAAFAFTADWTQPSRPVQVLIFQGLAALAAVASAALLT